MFSRKSKPKPEQLKMILRDRLAVDRTKLANQRTLLAFFRTGLTLIITAMAIFEFKHDEMGYIRAAWGMAILGGLVILLGFINFFMTRRNISNSYLTDEEISGKAD